MSGDGEGVSAEDLDRSWFAHEMETIEATRVGRLVIAERNGTLDDQARRLIEGYAKWGIVGARADRHDRRMRLGLPPIEGDA